MSYVVQECPNCHAPVAGGKFCRECGAPVVAEAMPAPTPPAKQRRGSAGLWTVAIVAMVLAVVGAGFGVAGFLKAHNNSKQITTLRHGLASNTHQQQAIQQQVSALKANSTTGAVTALKGQMSMLTTCIPEMQQEINGLTINTQSSSGWLTGADLSNPSITSQNCDKTLNGG